MSEKFQTRDPKEAVARLKEVDPDTKLLLFTNADFSYLTTTVGNSENLINSIAKSETSKILLKHNASKNHYMLYVKFE